MLVYDAVAGALPLLIISERYAFSPKFESEFQGGYAAGNALRKYAEGFEMPFSTPAAHARVAGPEQERVALRTVADSGKPLPLQPFGSACPSTRSGYAVPCGTSRSQTRVSSLPGPANPALCAPGRLKPALCPQNTPFLWTKQEPTSKSGVLSFNQSVTTFSKQYSVSNTKEADRSQPLEEL